MLELTIIVILLICGTVIGGIAGTTTGTFKIALSLAFVGGCFGIASAYILLATLKRSCLRKIKIVECPAAKERIAIGTQITFKTRMANYLKIAEPELQQADSYKSSMPFWCSADVFWRKTTRTAQELGVILRRIREYISSAK